MNSTVNISAIIAGDEQAFVHLYHQLNGKVYNFFLKRTGEPEMAKDCTQQCFIRIYHYRSSFSTEHPLEKQVYIIAKSILLNYIRAENRKTARELQYAKNTFPGGIDTSELTGVEFETQDILNKITRHLPPVRKKIILLKARQGLSNKEIAEQLSISVKTVESHITKANQHMRMLYPDAILIMLIIFKSM